MAAPDEPEVTRIHETSAAELQPHADVVVTVALNEPPAADADWAVGDSVNEHDGVGLVGEELWPHPTVDSSISAASVYRMFMQPPL